MYQKSTQSWGGIKLAIVAGLLFTSVGFAVLSLDFWAAKKNFTYKAEQQLSVFSLYLNNGNAALSSISGLFQATDQIKTADLRTFTQLLLEQYPVISSAMYLPMTIDEAGPISNQSELPGKHFLVSFIEPMDLASNRLLEQDILTHPLLKHTALAAIKSGEIEISKLTLPNQDTSTLWILRALYRKDATLNSEDDRTTSVTGLIAVQLNTNEILLKLFGEQTSIRLDIPKHHSIPRSKTNLDWYELSGEGKLWAYLLPTLTYSKTLYSTQHQLIFQISKAINSQQFHFSLIMFLNSLMGFLLVAVAYNNTQRRTAERHERIASQRVIEEQKRAQITLDSIGDAVITISGLGHVQYMNPVAEQMTGWHLKDALGQRLRNIFQLVNEVTNVPLPCPVERCLIENKQAPEEEHALMVRTDGETISVDECVTPISDSEGNASGVVMILRDVSLERRLTSQMAYQATHDSLTGIANRREFEQQLSSLLREARNDESQHALFYMDLDQFKFVNDSAGHIAGDRLLKQVSSALKSQIRKTDLLARVGGDEFAIILNHCTPERAEELAATLCQYVKEIHFHWEDKLFNIGISIGVVYINAASGSITSVLSAADSACIIAKDHGRGRYQVYQPDDKEISRRAGEVQSLHQIQYALRYDTFSLCLQKIVPFNDEMPAMGEFLIRMKDSKGNMVSPMAFIPSAERYGLMQDIDHWVIRHAMEIIASDHSGYIQEGRTPCGTYTINLSGSSVDNPDLINYILETTDLCGIQPSMVCFEITETAAISNLDQALNMMKALRSVGFLFALDDFGTGLSSFVYLKKLPVDYLKIDGEFIRDIVTDPIDQSMVGTMNHIAHVLGMKTIAEGVETAEVLDMLETMGIDYAQGYHLGRPGHVEIPELELSGQDDIASNG